MFGYEDKREQYYLGIDLPSRPSQPNPKILINKFDRIQRIFHPRFLLKRCMLQPAGFHRYCEKFCMVCEMYQLQNKFKLNVYTMKNVNENTVICYINIQI